MPRMRVHEIAKKFNKSNKETIEDLQRLGVVVTNIQSGVSDRDVQRLGDIYAPRLQEKPKTAEKKPEGRSAGENAGDRPDAGTAGRGAEGSAGNRPGAKSVDIKSAVIWAEPKAPARGGRPDIQGAGARPLPQDGRRPGENRDGQRGQEHPHERAYGQRQNRDRAPGQNDGQDRSGQQGQGQNQKHGREQNQRQGQGQNNNHGQRHGHGQRQGQGQNQNQGQNQGQAQSQAQRGDGSQPPKGRPVPITGREYGRRRDRHRAVEQAQAGFQGELRERAPGDRERGSGLQAQFLRSEREIEHERELERERARIQAARQGETRHAAEQQPVSHREGAAAAAETGQQPVHREPAVGGQGAQPPQHRYSDQEPRRERDQEPRREHDHEPRREHDQEPRREHDQEPRRERDHEPRREHDQEPRRERDQEPRRERGQGQTSAQPPRRDGQRDQSGAYPRRDGQRDQSGGYPRRDGQGQAGSYPRRDGQRDQSGGYPRRDGQGQAGSYPRRDGQGQQAGTYPRRDVQGQAGAPRRDGSSPYPRRDGQSGPPRGGYGQGGARGPGQGFAPRGDRPPAGGGRPGFGRSGPGGGPGGFAKKEDGGRPGFSRGGGARPGGFGKKDDKKGEAQPSKDDRKQLFQKNEQMRREKSQGKRDGDSKEGKLGAGKKGRAQKPKMAPPPVKREPDISFIQIPQILTVKELAEKLRRSGADVVKALMKLGVMATVNQEIDFEAASKVCEGYNVLVEEAVEVDPFEQAFMRGTEAEEEKVERPPVVVVMGHVDHGKTSLLDAIRDTNVIASEAGGITQRIGAYSVTINGKPITFLDTPGHEAFTAMRMRGAQVTDIAVLVVSAVDGVMPQTVEAINHAKAANVDILVAINMIDKPGADPDKVKRELTEYGLLVEDWGGETIAVPVSAKQRINIDRLLEMIIILAEMKQLRANPNKPARGTIIEAQLDKGRGPVATVLVREGTLNVGDTVIAGACFGHVRAMTDDKGRKVKKAGPSMPVEIQGLADVPMAGDQFYVAANEKQARMLSDSVIAKGRESMVKSLAPKISLDDLFSQIKAGSVKDLNIVVKADVQGSVEALRQSLEKLSNDEVRIKIIHAGVGAVTETDVMLASASNAVIIGFNVRPEPNAKAVADAEKVDIRLYRIIYNAIEDITAAMKGMLDPIFREKVIGHAEIRQLFKASGVGTIGGSMVTDGKITRGAQIRVIRDGKVVHEGALETLRRFKDDVREVAAGYECGILVAKFNDIKEKDIVEAFVMEEVPR